MSNILSYLKSGGPEGLKLTALAEELESKLNLLDRVLVVARAAGIGEMRYTDVKMYPYTA